MPLKEGDVVEVEYTLKVKDTGEIIETTDEKLAKEAGIYSERERYGPRIVVIGEGSLLPGLEEALKEMEVGEEKEIEIPPEKAYGPRDPSKVKIVSLGEFRKAGIRPEPGMVVEYKGMPAIVRSVSGGRVILDFNNPYAGKTIIAKVKVLKKAENEDEKIAMLIKRRLGETEYKVEGDKIIIETPVKAVLADNIQLIKYMLAAELMKYIDKIKEVDYIDKFRRKEESK